jgi:hypothetical protein
VTLRFAILGLELFTVTIELDNDKSQTPQPSLRSKLRQAVAHSVIR